MEEEEKVKIKKALVRNLNPRMHGITVPKKFIKENGIIPGRRYDVTFHIPRSREESTTLSPKKPLKKFPDA